jgi:hypothetical protein
MTQAEIFAEQRYQDGLTVGKAQRDALLAAAKAILAPGGGVYGTTELIEQLRAAIALAEQATKEQAA